MLKELYIENLAIIEKATISFSDKLNIFSGETGAGKSILIGGINAILGGRVNKDIVRNGTQKAIVTALFDEIPEIVKRKLEECGFECEDELMLQREILSDGKSTARINGRTATATVLREIATELVDIHGQHDNQILMSNDRQREIIDNYGNISDVLSDYQAAFRSFSQLSRQVKQAQADSNSSDAKIQELTEKIDVLSKYKFTSGEETEIQKKLEKSRGFETIQRALASAYANISGTDNGIGAINMLKASKDELHRTSKLIKNGDELVERLESSIIELEDIRSEISSQISDELNPQELAFLEERMSDILRLRRKYGMDFEELLSALKSWREQLKTLQGSESQLEQLQEKRRIAADEVKQKAAAISELRKTTAAEIEKKISAELAFLDMPNVRLIFGINQDKITVNGMDSVELLISVNLGEEPKPVNKIASGGELSRIMLAIKTVLAANDDIPTMIFDEIDTGISGRAAQKVGIKLSEIAGKRQVLCVTHLAQIAALADNHLLIEKSSDGERTYTSVRQLGFEERKREIARIISGDSDSEITLKNAEELLTRSNSGNR